MDQITDLGELLKHELKDLYSAEVQIIDGLPKMIEKARNPQLKKALSEHLRVTREQKKRLETIQDELNIENDTADDKKGFFANLFKSKEGEQHCKAMEGIMKEADSILSVDMVANVLDAAIIAAAQKVEHYEIGSYGTARAYAEQMGLTKVEKLLRQTLDEEYFADDTLTKIALEKVNLVAENHNMPANKNNGKSISSRRNSNQTSKPATTAQKSRAPQSVKAGNNKNNSNNSNATAPGNTKKKSQSQKAAGTSANKTNTKSIAKKAAPKKAATKKAATKKSATKTNIKSSGKNTASKKSAPKKSTTSKGGMQKTATKKSSTASKSVSKAAAKKVATKKSAAPKKSASKYLAVKKSALKKSAQKKSAAKKTTNKSNAISKKGPSKKSAAKKGAKRK